MPSKYILFSLEDEKTKKIAEVLANKTCKKILDLLAERELTEKEISLNLNAPLNTIEYNLKKLIEVNLIEQKSHFWSVKGKKMPVYAVSNKHIVISPKSASKFKSILPVVLISGAAAFLIKITSTTQFFARKSVESTETLTDASKTAIEALPEALPQATSSGTQIVREIINYNWLWFFYGCLFALVVYFLWNWKKR